jgi:hypothetical protein
MKKIKDLSKSERPRERLRAKGPQALSDIELLAVLLGSGTKKHHVIAVAGRILKALDGQNEKLSLEELQKIEGVGPAKATLIAAAIEFSRRRIRPEGLRIPFMPMGGRELALESAMNYRLLRKKGVTVRKTIDVMIGTFCIHYQLPLLHDDRDFDPMVKFLGLEVIEA